MKFNWKKAACAVVVCILSLMVAAAALAQGTYFQTTGNVHVRAGAGLRYRSLTTVKKGAQVEYLDQEKTDSRGVTWYKVKVNSKVTGWISSKYVDQGDETPRTVEITGKSVNLRNQPSLKGEKVDVLYKGDTALYLASQTDDRGVTWYQIRVNGGTCWVSSQYAKLVAVPSGSTASDASVVEVTGGKTYVRKSPSLKGKQVCVLSKGDTVSYLGSSSVDDRGVTWYSVRTSAGDGWISSRYTKLRGASKPTGGETATTGTTVEVVGGSTNVRRYPSLDGKKLYVLSKGDTAQYLSKTSVDDRGVTWYAIRTSEGEGWISSKYAKLR